MLKNKRRKKRKVELWDSLPEHPVLTNLKQDYASVPNQPVPVGKQLGNNITPSFQDSGFNGNNLNVIS